MSLKWVQMCGQSITLGDIKILYPSHLANHYHINYQLIAKYTANCDQILSLLQNSSKRLSFSRKQIDTRWKFNRYETYENFLTPLNFYNSQINEPMWKVLLEVTLGLRFYRSNLATPASLASRLP